MGARITHTGYPVGAAGATSPSEMLTSMKVELG